jgi:hypothetical protein
MIHHSEDFKLSAVEKDFFFVKKIISKRENLSSTNFFGKIIFKI